MLTHFTRLYHPSILYYLISMSWIFSTRRQAFRPRRNPMSKEEILNGLSEAVVLGKPDQAKTYAQKAIDDKVNPWTPSTKGS